MDASSSTSDPSITSADDDPLISDSSEFIIHPKPEGQRQSLFASSSTNFRESPEISRTSRTSSDPHSPRRSSGRRGRPQSGSGPAAREFRSKSLDDDYEIHQSFMGGYIPSRSSLGTNLSNPGVKSGDGSGGKERQDSSWEEWWVTSPLWLRALLFQIIILFVIGVLQLGAGLYFLGSSAGVKVRDPNLCTTPKCAALSKWMNQSNNSDVNPCVNFYGFTCQNHKTYDTGDLWTRWEKNIARLETDGENGESILGKILTQPKEGGIMGERIVKYYQVCMRMWQVDKLDLEGSLKTLIRHVFKEFDLWGGGEGKGRGKGPDGNYAFELEKAAAAMIQLLGDDGFYTTFAPVSAPKVILDKWYSVFMQNIDKTTVDQFLPIIYDGLGISRNLRVRHKMSTHFYHLVAKLQALIYYGLPKGNPNPTAQGDCAPDGDATNKAEGLGEDNFDFHLPFYLAYYGDDLVDLTDLRRPTLKGKALTMVTDPLSGEDVSKTFKMLKKTWNCLVKSRFTKGDQPFDREYIRPFYATLWSLRLLHELVQEADDDTAKKFNLQENPFFTAFQANFFGRDRESRCFQSLLDAMGYYPVFRYFQNQIGLRDHQKEAMTVVRDAAAALLEEFRPPEEGGLTYISSRYRERIHRMLGNPLATNVIIPTIEDDVTFTLSPEADHLAMTEDHIHNVIQWKSFTFKRTRHFWLSGSPQGKLVWYKSFYMVDRSNFYEAPSTTAVTLIRFPSSIFIYPFWNNDMEIANYAGARAIAAKVWMAALGNDYRDTNIQEDIKEKRSTGRTYREGIISDGDHGPCEIFEYDYFVTKTHLLSPTEPYELSVKDYSGIWGNHLPVRVMLRKFFEVVNGDLRHKDAFHFDLQTRRRILPRKLVGFEDFSEAQLYFLINFRETCRSNDNSPQYHKHVTTNLAALMQMKEFSEVWKCPPKSPMNPPKPCFN